MSTGLTVVSFLNFELCHTLPGAAEDAFYEKDATVAPTRGQDR